MQISPEMAVAILAVFIAAAVLTVVFLHERWLGTWPHNYVMFRFDEKPSPEVIQAVRALVHHFRADLSEYPVAVHLDVNMSDLDWVMKGKTVQAAARLAKGPVALVNWKAPVFEVFLAKDARDPQDNLLIHEVAAHIIPYLRYRDWNHGHDPKWRKLQNEVQASMDRSKIQH